MKKKVKPTGLPALSNLVSPYGAYSCNRHLELQRNHPEQLVFTAAPRCVFQPHDLTNGSFFAFGDADAEGLLGPAVVTLLGAEAGIVANCIQKDNWLKQGARDGYDCLAELVSQAVLSNPKFKPYLALTDLTDRQQEVFERLMRIAAACPKLVKGLGLPPLLDAREQQLLRLYGKMIRHAGQYRSRSADWEQRLRDTAKIVLGWRLPDTAPLRILVSSLVQAPAWQGLDLKKIAGIVSVNTDVNIRRFFEGIILKAHKV